MSWQEELVRITSSASKVAVLGAGSVLCGDDAAGMLVVEELQTLTAGDTSCLLPLAGSTAPENFTGVIRDYQPDLVLLVDAAYMDEAVGTVSFLDAADIKGINFSTHMLPLSVLADYLQQETGAGVGVIGIQPGSTDFDIPPSQAVKSACRHLAEAIYASMK